MFEPEGSKKDSKTGFLCVLFSQKSLLLSCYRKNWRIAPQTLQLYMMSCSRKTLKWDVFYPITSVLYTNGLFIDVASAAQVVLFKGVSVEDEVVEEAFF